MRILLPLFYAFLLATGGTPESIPAQTKTIAVQQPGQAITYAGILPAAPAPVVAPTAACRADATLTDAGAGAFGSPFMNCSSVGSFYTLTVQNSSTTKGTNSSYTIDWGDGSAVQTFPGSFTTTTHTYTSRGAFTLTFTAIDNNGCKTSQTYQVYNISNPGFTVGNPGSTTACLTPESPTVTFRFPVVGIETNPASTIYTFSFDDGSAPYVYTHAEMLARKEVVHTFNESSCSMPSQWFSLRSTAKYTCGGSEKTTESVISSIVINKSTNADFTIGGGPLYCTNNDITLGNATTNPELCPISYNWSILDGVQGVDWVFTSGGSGSAGVTLKFLKPGTYRIRLKTFTDGCGEDEVIKPITITESASAKFDFNLDKASGCQNLLVSTVNNSTGGSLTYNWSLQYNNVNAVLNNHYTINSGTLTSAAPKFILTKVGTYKIILKASNGCSNSTITKDVIVRGLPTVAFKKPTQENCGAFTLDYNGQLNITANNGTIAGYTWEVNNGATFAGGTNSSSANPKINFPGAGTYTINVTIRNECGNSSTATQTITVNPIPAAPTAEGKTICQNDAAQLTVQNATAGYTYKWYGQATGGAVLATTTTANPVFTSVPLTSDASFYVAAVSNKSCEGPRTEVKVKVLTAVTGNTITTTQTTYCEGTVPGQRLNGGSPAGGGGAPYTFLWEISYNGYDFEDAPDTNNEQHYQPSEALTKDTWFRRKVFNNPCQTVISDVIKLSIIPTPRLPIIKDASICYNQHVTLEVDNAEDNVTYYWYDAPTNGNLVRTGTTYTTPALQADKTYYVAARTQTAPVCTLPERKAVKVTVTPAMAGGAIISSPAATVCYNTSPGTITGNAPTGGTGSFTYKWFASTTNAVTDFAEVSSGTNPNYAAPALTQNTWFKRVAYSGSCEVASNVVEVRVEALPVAPTVLGTSLVCYGGSTTLTATAPGGTYHWYNTANEEVHTGNTFTLNNLQQNTTYFVSAKSALGCEGPKAAVSITVTSPIANNSISSNQSICSGGTPASLAGTLPTGGDEKPYRYLWEYSEDGLAFEPAPGINNEQSYTPIGTFTKDTWFRRKVSSSPCPDVVSNLVKITVIPLPQLPVIANADACYGSSITLQVQDPENGVKYRWYDQAIGGSLLRIGNDYKTPILTSSTIYYVEGITDNINGCVSPGRTPVSVNVTPALVGGDIISTPKASVCAGGSPGALGGDAPTGGTGTYTYQWYASTTGSSAGFQAIDNATTRTYTPENMAQTTWFKRVVTSANCTKESIVVRVVVEDAPAAPTVAGQLSICSGNSTMLTATAPGGKYIWYNASGAQLHVGTVFSPTLTATTTFYVEAESATGCVSPRTAVTVEVVPQIGNTITQTKTTICPNEDAGELSGAITGGTGSYTILWEQSVGGAAFTAATGINNQPNYSPGNLNATTTYRRKVKSEGCEVISNERTITITNTIASNSIFGGTTICEGNTPGTLSGNGEAAYTYQWYQSTTGADGTFEAIAGATARDHVPAALQSTTWYRRAIILGNCSSVSNTIAVQVQPAIANNAITNTGQSTICYNTRPAALEGSKPTGGNSSYTYLWQVASASAPNSFTDAPGTNTGQHYTPVTAITEATIFRRLVYSGTCDPLASNSVLVSVLQPVVNQISTGTTSYCANSIPAAMVSAAPITGGDPATYSIRWERSLNGAAYEVVSSTETYVPTEPLAAGVWRYRRIVASGGCAEVASNVLTITVNPQITGNELFPVSPLCKGGMVTLQGKDMLAGGTGSYTYQWQKSTDGKSFANISSATDPDYTTSLTQRTWFRRIVRSGECSSVSAIADVTVEDPIQAQITGEQSLCLGTAFTELSITSISGGNGKYAYQWEKSESGSAGPYIAISGATDARYKPVGLSLPTWYRIKVSGGACGDFRSNAVKVQYYPAITNKITGNQTICQGSAAGTLANQALEGGDGANYNFQWKQSSDGVSYTLIPGESNISFTPQNIKKTTWFKRVVTSGGCVAESEAVKVTVVEGPVNEISTPVTHICYNTRPERIIQAKPLGGSSGPYTFRWFKSIDGVVFTQVSGAVSESYQPEPLQQTTWYRRTVNSQTCGELESNTIKIQVDQPIAENYIKTANQVLCFGQSLTVLEGSTPTGGNNTYAYQWLMSTLGENAGYVPATGLNTNRDYKPEQLERTTWFKRVVYSSPCQEVTSPAVKVEVVPLPAIPASSNMVVCVGSSALLTATAAPGEEVEWYDSESGGKLLGRGPNFSTGKLTGDASYYVQAVNKQRGCASSGRREVRVSVVTPQASVTSDLTIQEGKTVQLRAAGGTQYQWFPTDGLSDPTSDMPLAKPAKTTTYTVTVTTPEGCTAKAEVTITVTPRILANNLMSVNGDGLNDKFIIKNIENYPNARVEIFNRWGEKVFESKGYTEPWDGTRNGNQLPMAAYYYLIYLNEQDEPIAGSVTIVK
ncbi:gliding motility-associated C-terminal domain-containing protein [uncultured Pontibacter sp.]|uniref:Ig-like domain-containing protein n=1 Tax=uncultured Pontibacter sp. TaxID=453356 RepID=UPI002623E5BA|nr:gliding motility-associated C-terminal domain-containing protein [uncultured Pontibacter sp.]